MKKVAEWNGQVIAESDDIVNIEGNYYFPIESVNKDLIKESKTESFCPWKGTANYCSLDVDGKENTDAVWYYAEPKDAAKAIKGRIAFWKGVEVSKVE
jgi:uncharacterized protein (DUF427 family)